MRQVLIRVPELIIKNLITKISNHKNKQVKYRRIVYFIHLNRLKYRRVNREHYQ